MVNHKNALQSIPIISEGECFCGLCAFLKAQFVGFSFQLEHMYVVVDEALSQRSQPNGSITNQRRPGRGLLWLAGDDRGVDDLDHCGETTTGSENQGDTINRRHRSQHVTFEVTTHQPL